MTHKYQLTIYYYLLFNITYYSASFVLFLVDFCYYNKFIKYKIQPKTRYNIINIYKKCLSVVLTNTFIYAIPSIYFLCHCINFLELQFSLLKMFFDLFMGAILTDILFYTCHRIFHIKYLYKKYHKIHHEITAPVGISALYTTPIDFYFSNIIPVYFPMVILSAHPYTINIWVILTTIITIFVSHGGFKWVSSYHDYHHEKFNKNYGINVFMDYLMGTKY